MTIIYDVSNVEVFADGGYAVADFRKVREDLGTMDDLEHLTSECHKKGINVCPSVLLLGEVVMEPAKVVPYFGTIDKPECHMLYNVTTMATTWHSVATRDVSLLKKQLDKEISKRTDNKEKPSPGTAGV